MTEKREPQPEDKRQSDDLELPDEAAEDVKGGQNVGSKFATQKVTYSKIK
jgi:hypothetical protein